MAYVPTCVYDVFLSYAHVDNPGGPDPWVDRFKRELETELRGELAVCVGDQRFVVWQDAERLKPGFSLTQSIRQALAKTAVVVSLYSPGYLASGYCAEERRAFEEHCAEKLRFGTSSRLINVIIRSNPDVVRLASNDLFATLATGAGPLGIGSDAFRAEFGKLVLAVKALLEGMRQQFPKVYVALTGPSGDPAVGASTAKAIEKLLEDLSQSGYARTTEIHPGFYSNAQIEAEISTAEASVHIVADPADPLTRRQIEAACRVGVPMVVWLAESARGTDTGWIERTIPGPRREYLTGSFAAFCDRVKDVVCRAKSRQSCGDPRESGNKTVFLLRNARIAADKQGAESIRRRLIAQRLNVTFEAQEWETLAGVLVYQRAADDRWFETKLEYVMNAPLVRAACTVPPPDKSRALRAAEDYNFKRAAEIDRSDPRLLLEGDEQQHLQPFVDAVLGR